jgi:hypothetical protein
VPSVEYRYELRRGEEVVATGHLSREQPLEVGAHLVIGGRPGIVPSIEALLDKLVAVQMDLKPVCATHAPMRYRAKSCALEATGHERTYENPASDLHHSRTFADTQTTQQGDALERPAARVRRPTAERRLAES